MDSASKLNCFQRKREERTWTKFHVIKNLMVVTLTIALVVGALGPSGDISSSLNISKGMGTVSSAVGNIFTILAYFFLPTLVINKFGLKYSMICFVCLESLSTLANFYPSWFTLIPGNIISSVAGVITRPAQKTSVATLAEKYAALNGKDKYEYINIFFAIYYSIASSGYIFGAIFSKYALNKDQETLNSSLNVIDYSTCGADFCDWEHENSAQFERPDQNKIYLFFGVSAAAGTLASLLILLIFDHLEEPGGKGSNSKMLSETFRIFKKRQNLLLIPITFQGGVMDTLASTEFTKGYITCTIGIYYVGLIMITYYVSQTIFSLLGPYLSKYVGRISVFTFAALLQGMLLLILTYYHPEPEDKVILHAIVFCLGLSGAVYQTLSSIMYSTLFADNRKAAFANFLLPNTVGYMVASAYSYKLCARTKIMICGIFGVFSYVCYLGVEIPIILQSRKKGEKDTGVPELILANVGSPKIISE